MRPLVHLTPVALLVVAFAASAAHAVGMADPVRVEYYMEALCPYCANLTLTKIQPLFKNKLINFVRLDLIPYGNARTDPNTGAVTCQHGPVECELNKLLSCAVAFNPIQDDWFPFLACVEEAGLQGIQPDQVEGVAHKCAVHAGLVSQKLLACYSGQLGDSLQRLAAQRTASLKPAHQYVPWVVVNGIPLLDDDENIMKYICVAYRGRDRPKVCLDINSPAQPEPRPLQTAAAAVTSATGDKGYQQQHQPQQRYERCKAGQEQQQHGSVAAKQQLSVN